MAFKYSVSALIPQKSDTFDDVMPNQAFLYVGGAGNVKVTTQGGSTLTFTNVPAGTFLGGKIPIAIKQVWKTGTTATGLVLSYNSKFNPALYPSPFNSLLTESGSELLTEIGTFILTD